MTKEHTRAFSSAGSEHLPYKQRVGGSNPSTPTEVDNKRQPVVNGGRLSFFIPVLILEGQAGAWQPQCVSVPYTDVSVMRRDGVRQVV